MYVNVYLKSILIATKAVPYQILLSWYTSTNNHVARANEVSRKNQKRERKTRQENVTSRVGGMSFLGRLCYKLNPLALHRAPVRGRSRLEHVSVTKKVAHHRRENENLWTTAVVELFEAHWVIPLRLYTYFIKNLLLIRRFVEISWKSKLVACSTQQNSHEWTSSRDVR